MSVVISMKGGAAVGGSSVEIKYAPLWEIWAETIEVFLCRTKQNFEK